MRTCVRVYVRIIAAIRRFVKGESESYTLFARIERAGHAPLGAVWYGKNKKPREGGTPPAGDVPPAGGVASGGDVPPAGRGCPPAGGDALRWGQRGNYGGKLARSPPCFPPLDSRAVPPLAQGWYTFLCKSMPGFFDRPRRLRRFAFLGRGTAAPPYAAPHSGITAGASRASYPHAFVPLRRRR